MEPNAQFNDKVVYGDEFSEVILRSYRDMKGEEKTWAFIRNKDFGKSAHVVAITNGGEIVLERSFRIPLKRYIIELPCGRNDMPNETPEDVARRELLEETGYGGGTYVKLAEVPELPGMSDQETVIFLAEGVEKIAEPKLGDSEAIETLLVPFVSAMEFLLKREESVDPKVFAALALSAEKRSS